MAPSSVALKQRPSQRRRGVRHYLLVLAALAVYWVGFHFLDPLSLEQALRSSSERFFSVIAAPFYGFGNTEGQENIAVVMVTDQTLLKLDHAWPLPLDAQAYQLTQILEVQPKAIFVDIVFPNLPRKEDPGWQDNSLVAFQHLIQKADQSGVPILFAQGGLNNKLLPPLTSHGAVTGWSEEWLLYPLLLPPKEKGGTPTPTAAFQLFKTLCDRRAFSRCPMDFARAAFAEPLYLRWGSHFDPQQADLTNIADCREFPGSGMGRLSAAISFGTAALFGGLDHWQHHSESQRCNYHLTISAEHLADTMPDGNSLASRLKGKVVFYGADIPGGHDVVNTSVMQAVAGVEVNTMALDNLITYGDRYFHRSPKLFFDIPAAEGVLFALWMLVSGAIVWRSGNYSLVKESYWYRVAMLVGIAIPLSLGLLPIAILLRTGHVSVPNLLFLIGLELVFVYVVFFSKALTHSILGRAVGTSLLAMSLFAINEMVMRWPPTDWFALVVLCLFVRGESGEVVEQTQQAITGMMKNIASQYGRNTKNS